MTTHSTLSTQSRRKPRQGRSKALVDAICQACLKIIKNGLGDQLSVSLIIKTAGVTKSSFYQYFPNVDTVIGYALANYDRGDNDEDFLLGLQLQEQIKLLSLPESIELLVNAACDRHLRLLKKYGSIYRRFHRNFNPLMHFDGENSDISTHKELSEWLRCIFEGHEASFETCSLETLIFLIATAIIDFTEKAVDVSPHLLAEESFRKTLINFFTSYFRQ